jgi:hypothetical protein
MNRSKILNIVLGVALVLVIAALVMSVLGQRVGSTFSSINGGLDGGSAAMPVMPAPPATGNTAAGGASGGLPALDDMAQRQEGKPEEQTQPGQSGLPSDGRLVIKNANLTLQVESVREAESSLRVMVGQLGGYVVKAETTGADEQMRSEITFRVPSGRFDQALSGAQGLAKKLLGRTITGDDVTEEFVDLSARQRALEATRDRLLTMLNKAEKVEEALAVNTSLTDIQAQLEQIEGRKKFLTQSAALSTITVMLTPVPSAAPIVEPEGWQPEGVARDALRGLVGFGQGLASIVIVLLVWSPVWGTIALLVFVWRRRRSKARAVAQSSQGA